MSDAANKGHAPRYQYDCSRCKFVWCCGPLCSCGLRGEGLPDPPRDRQDAVDSMLVRAGYMAQFHGTGAQRR